MSLILGFGIAFLLALCSMPLILRIATKHKLFDSIDERKIHTGEIPRLGGLGIFIGFAASVLLTTLVTGKGIQTGGRFLVVLLCMLSIHLLGLIDDFRNLKARYKFIVELLEATLLVAIGFRFQPESLRDFWGLLGLDFLAIPVSVIWIIGIINAVNLIDGMDGLAGGIAAFSAGIFGILFCVRGDTGAALACFAMLGATLGFLVFNFPPAKIFMGDSGALFLGFTLAVLPLIAPAAGKNEIGIVSAITVLLIPIYDTFAAILRRMRARISIFKPDKLHLHHKLLGLGLSVRSALLVIYGAQLVLCLAAMSHLFLPSMISLAVKIGTWVVFAGLFYLLGASTRKRETAVGNDVDRTGSGTGENKSSTATTMKTSLIGSAIGSSEASRT